MAVIDIVIIAVLLLFGIIGMIKGFLNTILSLFSSLASLGVAIFCAKPVAKFLNNVFGLIGAIGGKIAGSLAGTIQPFQSGYATNELTGSALKEYLAQDGLTFQERLFKLFIEDGKTFSTAEQTAAEADKQIVTYIGERLAAIISLVIATLVVFILLKIAVLLLAKLFDAITKNRAIGGLDRALGLIFGLVKASLIICVVLAVFYLIANNTVQGWIDNSTVTKWLYQYVTQLVETIVHKFNLPAFLTDLFPNLAG